MEKTSYSVEWLSESSCHTSAPHLPNRTTFHDMDFVRSRLDPRYPHGMESHAPPVSGMERSYGGHVQENTKINQGARILQETHASECRKAPQNEPSPKPASVQEDCQQTDQSSTQNPGSTSGEESVSTKGRTKFTTDQLNALEKSFRDHRYIGMKAKKLLAKNLKLSENQIKIWFQNRRMKQKRRNQDEKLEALISELRQSSYRGLNLPAPLPPIYPYGAPPVVLRPPCNAPPFASTTFKPYPYPPMLLPPLVNHPMNHMFPLY